MEKYPFKEIGDRLKELRGRRLSQVAFSEKIGIKQAQYNRYETGKNKPPVAILEKIAEFWIVSIDWILSGKETKEAPENVSEIMQNIKHQIEQYRAAGAIPKASISDEEVAIIKCLRMLSEKDSLDILRDIVHKIVYDKEIPRSDYTEEQLNTLRRIIKESRFFEQGIDLEGLLWGYDLVERRKKLIEEDEIKKGAA